MRRAAQGPEVGWGEEEGEFGVPAGGEDGGPHAACWIPRRLVASIFTSQCGRPGGLEGVKLQADHHKRPE